MAQVAYVATTDQGATWADVAPPDTGEVSNTGPQSSLSVVSDTYWFAIQPGENQDAMLWTRTTGTASIQRHASSVPGVDDHDGDPHRRMVRYRDRDLLHHRWRRHVDQGGRPDQPLNECFTPTRTGGKHSDGNERAGNTRLDLVAANQAAFAERLPCCEADHQRGAAVVGRHRRSPPLATYATNDFHSST